MVMSVEACMRCFRLMFGACSAVCLNLPMRRASWIEVGVFRFRYL
jgi:hypothetical protein